jgi:uncharacterized protein YaaQ
MKLIIAVVRDMDADGVTQALTTAGFRVTRTSSTGGLLRRGVSTLLIGVEDAQVDTAIEVMKKECTPPSEGGKRATVFVVPVEKFEQV